MNAMDAYDDISYTDLSNACETAYRKGFHAHPRYPSVTIEIGRARMWNGADDADFKCWMRFVQKNMPSDYEIVESTHPQDLDVVYSSCVSSRDAAYKELDDLFAMCWGEDAKDK